MENLSSFPRGWLHNLSDIKPGNSAILSGNKLTFYTVHSIGLIAIVSSVLASIMVIFSILTHRSSKKWDFSDRFPLYVAIADGIWGVVNLTSDHIILLVTLEYPDEEISAVLGLNVGLALGYQQLMCSGLAAYTYLKVVRRVSLDLGKGEWKLQAVIVLLLAGSSAIFYPMGAFGCSGYWFFINVNSWSGWILQLYISAISTICFLCTTVAYKAIKTVVNKQRRIVSMLNAFDDCHCFHATAAQCLTTFVYLSLCLYGPMTLCAWAFLVQYYLGVLEPTTVFLGVVTANSSGWANAWAYFHNKKIKEKRRLSFPRKRIITLSTSSAWGAAPFKK